jgi:hypothetical protein
MMRALHYLSVAENVSQYWLAMFESLLRTFYDEEVHRYVDVEPERGEVLYHFAIGHPVAGPRFKR